MSFRIRFLPKAAADANAIFDWLFVDCESPEGAEAWLDAYQNATSALAVSAEFHGFAPENTLVPEELRQFLFKTKRGRTYRGIYMIRDDEVIIVRIRGPGQALLSADQFSELDTETG